MTGERRADLHPPGDVVWICRTLEEAGYEAWAVGGAVRDALAGGKPGDWDLTTSARPNDVRRVFRRTVPIGIEHGTVGVVSRSGRMYEVTTFRRDVETDGRRARVRFADRLEEDLERRDFSINAVAWHPLTQEVRDPHGGVDDLAAGRLRTVGDPAQRFEEDRLRVLRALRFAGQFDLRIEPATWDAVRASADRLGNLSAERIREELWKVLRGSDTPSRALDLYAEAGVLRALYPEVAAVPEADPARWRFVLAAVDGVGRPHTLVRMAALLHQTGMASPGGAGASEAEQALRSAALARNVLRRLRSSNADSGHVTHLIAHHASMPDAEAPDAVLRRWLRGVGRAYVNDLFRLLFARCRASAPPPFDRRLLFLHARAAALLRGGFPMEIGDLAIDGRDLRGEGLAPGPIYSRILGLLLERVTDDPSLNTRERLLTLLRAELPAE